ncbi:MAG: DNA repair protein RecO [Lachnospiraceae bacterium]|nr:DNA repair protein RecO [Lachnospiraceae bacterium]
MDQTIITGMVLKATPINENDRRIVLLTKNMGKISAFARNSRKSHSQLLAATNPFVYGDFICTSGRDSYTMIAANVNNYFSELRTDIVGAYYGFYFLEVADYFVLENADSKGMLLLLYQTLKALISPHIDNKLIKVIFELKTLVIEGFINDEIEGDLLPSTKYALEFIMKTGVKSLYTFKVNEDVYKEMKVYVDKKFHKFAEKEFTSLNILKTLI